MSDVKVDQIGHLANSPELVHVGAGQGTPRVQFVVMSNKRRKDRETGEITERTSRVRWTLFGDQALNASKYLRKGSHVSVSGRLENNDYEKNGEMNYGFSFVAEEVEYLDSKAEAEARASRDAAGNGGDVQHQSAGVEHAT
jgi:single-strand DNA-binding protein